MSFTYHYHSPLGWLELQAAAVGLTAVTILESKPLVLHSSSDIEVLQKTTQQLDEYFAGQRREFDVPLALTGTEFQTRVWRALQQIPYGQVQSYLEVAGAVGSPKAMRAVGQANGRNPIAVIVPCHRVVSHDGGLGGYSAGLERKRWLLHHEGWL